MGNDERIMDAFRRAAKNGCGEVSVREITLITGIPQRRVRERIESMQKYGEVFDGPMAKEKPKYFRANPQLL